jgi:hypothetical protein
MPQNPQSEKYKVRRAKYQSEYHRRPEQRERFLARQKVYSAVKAGKLDKSTECEMLNPIETCFGHIQAHHKDYSKPLEVTWLCKYHHKKIHGLVN